ncbi:PAS domain S-box protein [Lacunimicrobium album]
MSISPTRLGQELGTWLGKRMLTTLTAFFALCCLLVLWNAALLVSQITEMSNFKAHLMELELRRAQLSEQSERTASDDIERSRRDYDNASQAMKATLDEIMNSLPASIRVENLVVRNLQLEINDLFKMIDARDRQALQTLAYGETETALDLANGPQAQAVRADLADCLSRLRRELTNEIQKHGEDRIHETGLLLLATSLIAIILVYNYRKRLHQQNLKLREYAARMKQLAVVAECTSSAVLMVDENKRITWCNDGFTRIMGYTLEEIRGKSPVEIMPSVLPNENQAKPIRDAIRKRCPFHGKLQYFRSDRSPGWMEIDCQPIFDDEGIYRGYMAIQSDVTERVQMEQALRDHQLRLEMALQGGDLGFWDWDITTGHVYYSDRYYSMLGYEHGDLAESIETCIGLNHPDDFENKDAHIKAHLRGETDHFEIISRMRRKDGSYAWIHSRGYAYSRDAAGNPLKMSGTHMDVSHRKSTEDELARRHSTLENVINGVSDAIIIADFEYRITMCNRAVEMLFGFSQSELIGKSLESLQLETTQVAGVCLPVPFAADSATSSEIVRYVRRDRSQFSGETIRSPLRDRSGVAKGSITVIRDVTIRMKAEDDIRRAKEEAELASRTKSEFLANMSHEIRTPMTAILGYTDLLNDAIRQSDFAQQNEFVGVIRRNGEHLLQVINDILDLSKIEAGFMTLECIDYNPRELVQDVVRILSARAHEKSITLDLHFEGLIPARIQSDPTRVKQILFNLIGNAVKFTEEGSVTVTVRALRDVHRHDYLISFEIKDTGIGMTEKQQDMLFMPFTQADSSTTRRFGGTGLGLTIAKRLAEILGGAITVDSQFGQGSTFTLILTTGIPINASRDIISKKPRAAEPAQAVDAPTEISAEPLMGTRILLVEDGPDNQRLISFLLKKAGVLVTICENGQLAVDRLMGQGSTNELFVPDVVLMDMQMPVLDGYQAARELRSRGYDKPIIALTAHAMAGDREKCLEAGCDDFLTKPIDKIILLEKCTYWRNRKSSSRPVA